MGAEANLFILLYSLILNFPSEPSFWKDCQAVTQKGGGIHREKRQKIRKNTWKREKAEKTKFCSPVCPKGPNVLKKLVWMTIILDYVNSQFTQ